MVGFPSRRVNSGIMKPDGSYGLAQSDEIAQRMALLDNAHMKGLCDFVRDLRNETGRGTHIPNFDPLDGGNQARVLFLMEAPGPKAVASGFISRDNPDPTARNLKHLLAGAGIEREQSALWNLVPWYIGNETVSKIRPVTKGDARQSASVLQQLWPLFPNLQAVVLMGRKAQGAQKLIEETIKVRIFPTFHTSNQAAPFHQTIADDLKRVAQFVKQNRTK